MKASILVLQSALLVAGVMNVSEAARGDNGLMSFFSSRTTEEDSNMLYSGFRSLSWVSPKDDDDVTTTTKGKKGTAADDDDTAAATDDDSTSKSSSAGTSLSPLAKAAQDTATDDDSTTSTAKSASAAATTTTSSTATAASGGGGDDDDDGAGSASSSSTNSTAGGNATDVEDETKAPAMNPIIDDMILLFDDDSIKANATSLFPSEEEQPESWPLIVTIIFLVAAVALIGATCYKQYRKRKTYTSIPTDIDV